MSDANDTASSPAKPPGCGAFLGFFLVSMFSGQAVFSRAGADGTKVWFGVLGLAGAWYFASKGRRVLGLLAAFVAFQFYGAVLRSNDPEYQKKQEQARVARAMAKVKALMAKDKARFEAVALRTTAAAMVAEFRADEAAATAKYKGKEFVVLGTIDEVVSEGEHPRLTLAAGNGTGVFFRVPDGKMVAVPKAGERVEVWGEFFGVLLSVPTGIFKEYRYLPEGSRAAPGAGSPVSAPAPGVDPTLTPTPTPTPAAGGPGASGVATPAPITGAARPTRDASALAEIERRLLAGMPAGVRKDSFAELYAGRPLILAVRLNKLDDAAAAIEAGADLEAKSLGNDTAAMIAIGDKNAVALGLLLRSGIALDPPGEVAATPLQAAIQVGWDVGTKRILEYKADPNRPDTRGQTPLHLAVIFGHHEIVDILLAHRADASRKNREGKTPADLAAAGGEPVLATKLRGAAAIAEGTRNLLGKVAEGRGALRGLARAALDAEAAKRGEGSDR